MNTNDPTKQHDSLNRLHSAIGGELLDGIALDSPAAKDAMASILLNANSSESNEANEANENMSVSMVKRALGLGM